MRTDVTATKGDDTVRLAPLADHGVYIGAPGLKAMTGRDATDTETPPPTNRLTGRPWRRTCGFGSRHISHER